MRNDSSPRRTATATVERAVAAIEMREVTLGSMHDPDLSLAEHIDWTVAAGEFWTIGGLQGSGKTDFLFLTAGLMPPRAGSYRLFGEVMPIFDEARLSRRLRLGLVFENGQLFNQLTVQENLTLPVRYRENLSLGEANERLGPLAEALELGPWLASTPGALPRNILRRVGLGRALALRPDLLLVDNPLAGLDLRHAQWWRDFLTQLCAGHAWLDRRPITVIVTAPNLRTWEGRAQRFAVLRHERLTVLGSWEEVSAAPPELVSELISR